MLSMSEKNVSMHLESMAAMNRLPVVYQPVLDYLRNKDNNVAQAVDYSQDVALIHQQLNPLYLNTGVSPAVAFLHNHVSPTTPTNNGLFHSPINAAANPASLAHGVSIANGANGGQINQDPNGNNNGGQINQDPNGNNQNGNNQNGNNQNGGGRSKKKQKQNHDPFAKLPLDSVNTFEHPLSAKNSINYMVSWNIDRMEIDNKRRNYNRELDEEERIVDNFYINRIGLTRMPHVCYPGSDLSRTGPKPNMWHEFNALPFSMRKAYYADAASSGRGKRVINTPNDPVEFRHLPTANKSKCTNMEFV